jgi:multidrug resistance efflux pump
MKHIVFLIFIAFGLNATEYFAKIEPYEKHTISSQVNGNVVFVDKSKEYKFIDKKSMILKLDTKDEQIQLDTLKNSLALQKNVVKIKEQNYKNKVKVKQLSIYNKNQEKLSFIEAKQSLENIKRDIKTQERNIEKKEFFVTNQYIDNILVSHEEYVTTGTKLYTLYNFSKLKLEVFVRDQDLDGLKNRDIFINGAKSEFVVEKIAQVRDEKRVSTYKVILSKINSDKNIHFGKVVKVEFR